MNVCRANDKHLLSRISKRWFIFLALITFSSTFSLSLFAQSSNFSISDEVELETVSSLVPTEAGTIFLSPRKSFSVGEHPSFEFRKDVIIELATDLAAEDDEEQAEVEPEILEEEETESESEPETAPGLKIVSVVPSKALVSEEASFTTKAETLSWFDSLKFGTGSWLNGFANGFFQLTQVSKVWAAEQKIKISKVNLFNALGDSTPVELRQEFVAGRGRLTFAPKGDSFRPGRYTVEFEMLNSEAETTETVRHEFVWGVLAINVNQSIYLPGERAYIQIASLDENGHTLCDSELTLEIEPTGDTFSTADGTIIRSDTCDANNVTDEPDYFAYYPVASETGRYKLVLTNEDNGYSISDTFEVRESVPFEIERIGATRINPFKADYQMTIRVTANQDFSGLITEEVPAEFEISGETTWPVDLSVGETRELTYRYQAPEVSPQAYLLGPLSIGDSFAESRRWQIAADALCSSVATGNWTNGANWVNCTGTGGVPGTGDTVGISDGDNITFDPSSAEVLKVTIAADTGSGGGTLTFGAFSRTLILTGTTGPVFTNNGTFTSGGSTISVRSDAGITLFSGTFTGSNAFNSLTLAPTLTADRTYTFGVQIETKRSITVAPDAASSYKLTVEPSTDTTIATTNGGLIIQPVNSATAEFDTTVSNYTITSGSVSVYSNGTFTANGSTVTLNNAGLTRDGTGVFDTGTSEIIINRKTTGTVITGDFSGSNKLNKLTLMPTLDDFSGNATYTFSGAIETGGDFNLGPITSVGDTLTVNIGGDVTVASTATTTLSSGTANVIFDLRPDATDYDLSTGHLDIQSGGTLDATSAASTITLTGTSGTLFTRAGTFTAGSSEVIFNGDGSPTALTSGTFTSGNAFNDLTLSPTITAGRAYAFGSGSIATNGDFTINPSAASSLVLTVDFDTIAVGSSATTTIAGASSATSVLNHGDSFSTGHLDIQSGGTFTIDTGTLSLTGTAGTLLTRSGTGVFDAGSSTVSFSGDGDVTLTSGTFTGSNKFNKLTITPVIGANRTYTFGSGAIETDSDFTITPTAVSALDLTVELGASFTASSTATTTIKKTGGTTTSELDTTASDHSFTTGHLDIQAGGTLTANGSTVTVNGNYANNGTFTADTSTVVLGGTSKQTLSGTLVGSSGAFYNLTITNNSGTAPSDCEVTAWVPSVDFATTASSTNNYEITTGSVKVEYEDGALYSFQNINWHGQAVGTPIYFRNSAASGAWLLDVSGTQTAVSYVDVSRSDASSGLEIDATDGTNNSCGNNTNWDFTSLTFAVSTSAFPELTPGGNGPVFATSTLSVNTSSSNGWNVTLYGVNQGSDSASTTMYWKGAVTCDSSPDYDIGLTDQTEWIPGAATTTAGNAVRISSLDNSGDVLAFRVMTASGSEAFRASDWWGSADDYVDNANTLWAGVASTTAANQKIGQTSVSSGGGAALNTILYYLDAPLTQTMGCYEGEIVFTATTN